MQKSIANLRMQTERIELRAKIHIWLTFGDVRPMGSNPWVEPWDKSGLRPQKSAKFVASGHKFCHQIQKVKPMGPTHGFDHGITKDWTPFSEQKWLKYRACASKVRSRSSPADPRMRSSPAKMVHGGPVGPWVHHAPGVRMT